jgi:hypothetical protein
MNRRAFIAALPLATEVIREAIKPKVQLPAPKGFTFSVDPCPLRFDIETGEVTRLMRQDAERIKGAVTQTLLTKRSPWEGLA